MRSRGTRETHLSSARLGRSGDDDNFAQAVRYQLPSPDNPAQPFNFIEKKIAELMDFPTRRK